MPLKVVINQREHDCADAPLSSLTTRHLLGILKRHRISSYYESDAIRQERVVFCNQIKLALASREHIPNKLEAKTIRRKRAQS